MQQLTAPILQIYKQQRKHKVNLARHIATNLPYKTPTPCQKTSCWNRGGVCRLLGPCAKGFACLKQLPVTPPQKIRWSRGRSWVSASPRGVFKWEDLQILMLKTWWWFLKYHYQGKMIQFDLRIKNQTAWNHPHPKRSLKNLRIQLTKTLRFESEESETPGHHHAAMHGFWLEAGWQTQLPSPQRKPPGWHANLLNLWTCTSNPHQQLPERPRFPWWLQLEKRNRSYYNDVNRWNQLRCNEENRFAQRKTAGFDSRNISKSIKLEAPNVVLYTAAIHALSNSQSLGFKLGPGGYHQWKVHCKTYSQCCVTIE